MKIHERTVPVTKACNEASMWLLEWEQRHGLTPGEVVKFLAGELQMNAKYMIREERHPGDHDRKGDEA